MIYLDKTNQPAIDFVANFIQVNWLEQNDNNYKYQNIGFDEIKSRLFKQFFIDDQNDRCCYCGRSIINDSTTELEHIIPRAKSVREDFIRYYELSDILSRNVVPQNDFVAATVVQPTPPFPHHIAYQNIVASCNGRTFHFSEDFTCCNRNRGDVFIPPFNLIENAIAYLPDGAVVYMRDLTNRDYFEVLNLDKTILVDIRRLWYLFSRSELSVDEILDDYFQDSIKEKIVRFAIANSTTPVDDTNLTETFSVQATWNIFKQYHFFYFYYKNSAG